MVGVNSFRSAANMMITLKESIVEIQKLNVINTNEAIVDILNNTKTNLLTVKDHEELDKLDKFLASNNVNFRSYVLALDSELLAHIVDPYRAEMKREIEDAVASFFLEKDRAKQEEERAKSLERQKQNLFIEKTNGFASSMLGKNLAIQR